MAKSLNEYRDASFSSVPDSDAPHEDRRHDRPRLARPRDAHADGRGGARRRAAELLPRQPRDPRRERRAGAGRRRQRRAPGGDPPGPAGPEDPHRRARGRHRRAQAGRDAGARRAAPTEVGDERADVGQLGRAGRRGRSRRRHLPRRRRDPPAGRERARRRRRDRDRGRDRRHRRLAPGAQHPRLDPRAARRARGGPRHAPLRRVDRRRPGGAVVRAHGRGRRPRCASTRGCR